MTNLDEAIKLHDQIADSYKDTVPDCDEAQKHRQLANWLRELKAYRVEYREHSEHFQTNNNSIIKELEFAVEHNKGIKKECYQKALNLVRQKSQ